MKKLIAGTKTKIILKILFITILILTASIIRSLSAQPANTQQALEVSPPTQEVKADPGQTITITATVANKSETTLPISVRVENFIAAGDEGQVALTETGPWAVSTWTTISPDEFSLKPGERKDVTAKISIPQGEAGGRYGSFVFSIAGAQGENTATSLSQEVASLFLIRLSGDVNEQLTLKSLTAPEFSEFGPVPLVLTYENTGNVHLRPRGTITIKDMLGRIIGFVHADATNIFPGATRKVPLTFPKKLLIGRFTAEAAVRSGGTNRQELLAQTTFIIFPVRLAAIILMSAIVIFLLRKRIIKALKILLS
jgi:hypothetical protein